MGWYYYWRGGLDFAGRGYSPVWRMSQVMKMAWRMWGLDRACESGRLCCLEGAVVECALTRRAKARTTYSDLEGLMNGGAFEGSPVAAQLDYSPGRRMSQVMKMAWRMSSLSNSGLPVGL